MSKQTLAAIEDGIGRVQLVENGIIETCLNCGYKVCRDDQEASFQQVSFGLWNMLGYSSEAAFIEASCGRSTGAAYSEEDAEQFRVSLAEQLARNGEYRVEYRLKKADGTVLWVLESGRYIATAAHGRLLQSMVVDITRQKELEEKLLRQDAYDSLTGIYNKKTFYQRADVLLKKQAQRVFEVIYLDVERFKLINDLFGEAVGNELLLYLAQCLRDICIEDCVYGRLQSDNFALCFPAENNNRERFIQEIQNKVKQFPLHYRIIVGFGVYQVTDRNLSVSSMCDRARMAFRQIQGKYMVSCGVYDERMRQRIVAEQEIVNEMERALSERQFEVYFQPKYDLGTENIRGAEALVRWRHPTKGMMPPAEFIPVFERNGFIMKLDEYIWDSVCAFLRKSFDAGIEPLPISVNMSRFDLYNEKLCDILTGIVQKYDVDPKLLGLELTESAYMENPQQIIEITKKLQSHGFEQSRIRILAILTRLRQICCHPSLFLEDYSGGCGKLDMLEEVVEDAVAAGHRMLIFSQFTTMLKIIGDKLRRRGIAYEYLDGQTPAIERMRLVKSFNSGTQPIFLISLKAGGTGLNLTGADMVIHYDPWWNPAVEDQATDRAYRLGQKKNVQVLKFITKNTIEEKIFELQQKKKMLIDQMIQPGENFLSKLSEEEIRDLFK